MTNNELKFFDPETGAELHRVPDGATISADTPVGYVHQSGFRGWVDSGPGYNLTQYDSIVRFTREPIAPPKPPLPTEPGSLIRAVNTEGDECAMMIRLRGGDWVGVDQDGDERHWGDDGIVSWEPMAAIPIETWKRLSVLDPEDARDRVDRDGDLMRIASRSKAHWGEALATVHWNYGPLRFADEVSDR